jgi:phosphomannomutase
MTTLRGSLDYEPVELGFGTSGLRGLVVDMTDLECYINTAGFLRFLDDSHQIDNSATIYLAGDLRDSSPLITLAVAAAIFDKGYAVVYGGLVPTPAIANFALRHNGACVMVTGSHIPADRNGIKFYKVGGEILKDDEDAIKRAVASERQRIYDEHIEESKFDTSGKLKEMAELPQIDDLVRTSYLKRYSSIFINKPLQGKKVVVYQHSAVGRDMLVELLHELGVITVSVGRSDVFVPIDTENVTLDDQTYFKKIASENPDAFAIISTDGDSDRPFVIDEIGIFHRGDDLGAIVAHELNVDFAAFPISSSDAVDEFLKEQNTAFVHTKIGSPYVIVAMAQSNKLRPVGWEVNGGFLLGADMTINGYSLQALPTRDAFFPILVSLIAATKKHKTISALFSVLPRRFTQAGLIDNFPVEASRQIVGEFLEDSIENRVLLEQYFSRENGFSKVASINSLDGIRIYFNNGDIAHLRPSGNAPQMRMYSVSSTQARADEIVALGIRGNGILRRLEQRFKDSLNS